MKWDPYFTPYVKINIKWISNLNIRTKIMKLLENTVVNLHGSRFGNAFLDMTRKAQGTKEKNKLDFKIKFFCANVKRSRK